MFIMLEYSRKITSTLDFKAISKSSLVLTAAATFLLLNTDISPSSTVYHILKDLVQTTLAPVPPIFSIIISPREIGNSKVFSLIIFISSSIFFLWHRSVSLDWNHLFAV